MEDKNTRRIEMHKEAILSDAKKKLSRRDFMEFKKLMDKLNPIKRHGE